MSLLLLLFLLLLLIWAWYLCLTKSRFLLEIILVGDVPMINGS